MIEGKLISKKKYRAYQIGVILFTLLLLLSAWNSGNNILYLAFAISLSFIVVGEVFGNLNLLNFKVSILTPDQVVKGENATIWLRIENLRRLLPSLGVSVEVMIQDSTTTTEKVFVNNTPFIPPKQGLDISFIHKFTRRGKILVKDVILSSEFPFGLVRFQLVYKVDAEVLVTPRYHYLNIDIFGNYAGGCRIPLKTLMSESGEFYSLREYQPGDDIRYIAWKISARLGIWLVREWAVSMPNQYVIFLDLRADEEQNSESFEDMIDFTASVVYSLLAKQLKVGLWIGENRIPVNSGNAHFALILSALALVSPDYSKNFNESLWKKFLSDGKQSRLLLISILPELWNNSLLNGLKVAVPDEINR